MTDSYSVRIKRSAERELKSLSKTALQRIIGKIRALSENPRARGWEKLSSDDRYRVRQGDDRVVYAVDDERQVVEIVKIGHRREVYRK